MRRRDAFDAGCSAVAIVADALAVFGGFMAAEWIRFESGWLPLWLTRHFIEPPPNRMFYVYGAMIGALILTLIFRSLRLYERPQFGQFSEQIPRVTRAVGIGILLSAALAFAIRTNNPPFSRVVVLMSLATVWMFVLIERGILFRAEIALARRKTSRMGVIMLGTDETCSRLRVAMERDPRLRARVVAFLKANSDTVAPSIPSSLVRGGLEQLPALLDRGGVEQIILGPVSLPHEQMVELLLECQRRMIDFRIVPDLFRVLTSGVEVRTVGGVPLLGLTRWPLDYFANRFWKRMEDVAGALLGLILSSPVIAVAAVFIKASSPGPVFYTQDRCGRDGRPFRLFKLRTMRKNAEEQTGPVWTAPEDPRRTRTGAFLRRWNLDELPQFWNVLRGDMSLVGPRPERPHFVEQFRGDLERYMMRHVSKPGMTGWAQINGFRGQTDLRERLKYDLWYLENWSLALDFKILVRTLFAWKNAY